MTVLDKQTNSAKHDPQVLIVGGGPVGLGLAIDLGQRGISVVVIERHKAVHRVPKGQNLTQRSGEHFRAWGVSQQIRAAAPIPHDYGSAGLTAYGTLLGDYTYDWYRRAEVRKYYFADAERLPQYETETVLRDRAAQLDSIDIYYGWTVTDLKNDDNNVSVNIQKTDKSEAQQLTADYVVGCDGSGSVTRELAGIDQHIEGHDRRMVLLVFNSMELHRLLDHIPGKSYFNVINPKLDGYWQFLGRVDLNGKWFFHAPVPAGTTKDNFDFTALLREVVGAEFSLVFEHIGFWDLRIAAAKTYHKDRIFIAGDAAHSHPPYGGFGINTGFEDARNLGWKLAATLNGWGGKDLLDSYGEERLPVFRSTAEKFIGRMIEDDRQFINQYDPITDRAAFEAAWAARATGGNSDVTAYAPHYTGSSITCGQDSGPPSAVGNHSFQACAGRHLPPHALASDEMMIDVLGSDFTLIAMGEHSQVAQKFILAAGALGVPLKIVTQTDRSIPNNYGSHNILVRPDHFVAWTGDSDGENACKILRQAIGKSPN